MSAAAKAPSPASALAVDRRLPLVLRRGSPTHRGLQVAVLVAVALLVWSGAQLESFRVGQLTTVMIDAIAIGGLNLATGYTGLLSIGHSAFFGLGAYTTGVLVVSHGWDPLATIPVAVVLCFVVGVVIGLPALRIRGLYLALVTLAVGVSFPEIIDRFDSVTGGSPGLVIRVRYLRPPGWSGFNLAHRAQWLYWLSVVMLVVTLVLVRNLVRSRMGLALIACRDNEIAASGSGVNLALVKTTVFGVSSAVTGLGGSLFAMQIGALSADSSFTLLLSITLITGLVIGGTATLLGPLVGAAAVVFIPYETSNITQGEASGIIFGAVLIAIVFVMPEGIVGMLSRLRHRVISIRPAHAGTPVTQPPVAGAGRSSQQLDRVEETRP